jgi:hypothetical protein
MDRRGSTSVPAGDRMVLREIPRRCLKAAADGRRLRRTPPSSGRRARRRRRSGLDRRARRRLDRASRPRPNRSVARNAATATRRPRDRSSDPRSLRATSRCTAAWTHRRRRGPPSDQRSLPPVSRRQASSSRPRRGPRPGRTERRGPGMSMRRAPATPTGRRGPQNGLRWTPPASAPTDRWRRAGIQRTRQGWLGPTRRWLRRAGIRKTLRVRGTRIGWWHLRNGIHRMPPRRDAQTDRRRRRHRIRWTFPGPCRRLGGSRSGPRRPRGRDLSDLRRSGGRAPSAPSAPWPCPHPTGGPQPRRSTPRSCPRLGVGGGLGWWPWCWRWPW